MFLLKENLKETSYKNSSVWKIEIRIITTNTIFWHPVILMGFVKMINGNLTWSPGWFGCLFVIWYTISNSVIRKMIWNINKQILYGSLWGWKWNIKKSSINRTVNRTKWKRLLWRLRVFHFTELRNKLHNKYVHRSKAYLFIQR